MSQDANLNNDTKEAIMAGKASTKKNTAPHAVYADKDIPSRMKDYADWLTANTGYVVDPRSVYLSSSLRATFQKSDENQERIALRAQEREQEILDREQRKVEREEARQQREAEKAERAAAREAAKAEKSKAEKSAPKATAAKKSAPAKSAPKPAAKKPAAKATPATNRRRPAKAASKGGEDF